MEVTNLTPIVMREIFFSCFVLVLRSALHTIFTLALRHNRPKKSTDHGVQRLLPLALPMGWRRPNPAYCRHPHTMG